MNMKKENNKPKKINLILSLFWDYFKIGLFTFGGGYAMISLIEKTFVEKRKYISEDELLNIITIAEATPGVFAVNSATYIGYKVMKFFGALVSTIAVCLPSFIIILILSAIYDKFISISWVKYFVDGLIIAEFFLIANAGVRLFKAAKKDILSYILIILSFLSLLIIRFLNLNFSTIYILLIGGAISLILYIIKLLIKKKKDKREKAEYSDIQSTSNDEEEVKK